MAPKKNKPATPSAEYKPSLWLLEREKHEQALNRSRGLVVPAPDDDNADHHQHLSQQTPKLQSVLAHSKTGMQDNTAQLKHEENKYMDHLFESMFDSRCQKMANNDSGVTASGCMSNSARFQEHSLQVYVEDVEGYEDRSVPAIAESNKSSGKPHSDKQQQEQSQMEQQRGKVPHPRIRQVRGDSALQSQVPVLQSHFRTPSKQPKPLTIPVHLGRTLETLSAESNMKDDPHRKADQKEKAEAKSRTLPQMNRNITDPSKIIKVGETPPAPHRIHKPVSEAKRAMSPTPRRHKLMQSEHSSSSSEAQFEEAQEAPDDRQINPPQPIPGESNMPKAKENTKPSVPAAQHITRPHLRTDTVKFISAGPEQPAGIPTKNYIIEAPVGPVINIGRGAIASKPDKHITSVGIEVETANYALPEGHSQPWVRNSSPHMRVTDPPAAFLLRSLVPASYKDSALKPNERANAFNDRLTDIERMTGLNARYPSDRDYERSIESGTKRIPIGGIYETPVYGPPRILEEYLPDISKFPSSREFQSDTGAHNAGHEQQRSPTYHRPGISSRGHIPLLKCLDQARSPVTTVAAAGSSESECYKSTPPGEDFISERRIVYLESIPEAVTIAHLLRALGNTGRLEELDISENFRGRYATIKFVTETTARIFAERKHLKVPISREVYESLPIYYGEAVPCLVSEIIPIQPEWSRILIIGPCPGDYFVNAYLEYSGDYSELKATLVDYVWDICYGLCTGNPSHFLDVSLETRGNVIKAVASFASIKAAMEVSFGLNNFKSLAQVNITFGRDPCQGPTERRLLGIKDDVAEDMQQKYLRQVQKPVKLENKPIETEASVPKKLTQSQIYPPDYKPWRVARFPEPEGEALLSAYRKVYAAGRVNATKYLEPDVDVLLNAYHELWGAERNKNRN